MNTHEDSEMQVDHRSGLEWLRIGGVWLFGILAVIAFGTYVVVRWVERQILTTDNWVAMVSPLPKQPVVSTALGTYISGQVINTQNIETRITNALPPRADFLAGPLANQIGSLTTRAAQRIVASDAFQTIWEGANRIAMNRLLATARGQTPPLQAKINERFDINISQVGGQLAGALGTASNAIPALQPASQKLIDVQANLQTRPHHLQQAVQTADTMYAVLPLATAALLLTALAMSRRRRAVFMAILIGAALFVLSTLVGLKLARSYTLDKVQHPENLSAVGYIFDTITAGLKSRLGVALLSVAILFVVCLLAAPYKWAERFRSFISLDRVARSRVGYAWDIARTWTSHWKYYLWLAVVLIVLACLAFMHQVTGRILLNSVFLTIGLWAAIYIFGTPPRHLKATKRPKRPVTPITAPAT